MDDTVHSITETHAVGRMTTPLYPIFRKRIDVTVEQLIRDQVTPWSFLTAGPPFRIKTFDERQISYEGVGFDGSPREVFWSRYIEPFLEDICLSEIRAAVEMAKDKGVDARSLLLEIQSLLSAGFLRVYNQMAVVDRRLRGRGYPKNVTLKSVDREIAAMNQFLIEHIRAELTMWKPESRAESWFKRNKFLAWVIGILLGLIALLAQFV